MDSLVFRRRCIVVCATIVMFLRVAASTAAQDGLLVYATNVAIGDEKVSVLRTNADGSLTSVTAIAAIGGQPNGIAMRGDQAFAYVTLMNDDLVKVIDTSTHTVVQSVPTGSQPHGVTVSPDGTRVYVANLANGGSGNSISVFDADPVTGLLSPQTTIATGANTHPRRMALNADGSRLYVACAGTGANGVVLVIDTNTNTVLSTVNTGGIPTHVAVNPSGTRLYVPSATNRLFVIDTASASVIADPTGTGDPRGVAVSADGARVYVTIQSINAINQFETVTNTSLGIVAAGAAPNEIVIAPDGRHAYLLNYASATAGVYAIDAVTGLLSSEGTVATGAQSPALAMCGAGHALLATGRTFVARTAAALGCASEPFAFTGGTLRIAGSGLTLPRAMTLGASGGTIDSNGHNVTVSGAIGGAGGMIKAGAGTMVLSAINTYAGATMVSGGVLHVDGSLASSVTVQGGAVLSGSGSVANVMALASSTIAPGASPGILTAANVSFEPGATLAIELNGATAGAGYDRLAVSGTAALNGATLALTVGFAPANLTAFTIVTNAVGTFAGLPEGGVISFGSRHFRISYVGGDGTDVVLTALDNQPPVLANLTDTTTVESTLAQIPFTVNDDGTAASAIVVTASSSNQSLVLNGNIAVGGSGASRTLSVTPLPGQRGQTTISVTASDGLLSSTVTFVLSVVRPPAPNPPSNLTFSVSGTSVTFSWHAPTTGSAPVVYVLDSGTAPGSTNLPPIVIPNAATTFTTTLPPGGYFVRVRGANATGTSGPSNEVAVAVSGAAPVPGAPTGLAVQVTGSEASATWSHPTTGGRLESWRLDVGSQYGASDIGSFAIAGDATSASGALAAGLYYARLRGANAAGAGPASNEVQFTVGWSGCPAVPEPPLLLPAVVSGQRVTLSWLSQPWATSHQVRVGTAPGLANIGTFAVGAGTSFMADAVPPGQYEVTLVAEGTCGTSAPSNNVTVVVSPSVAPLGAPSGVRAAVNGSTATVNWDAVPGAVYYQVEVGYSPGASDAAVLPLVGATLQVTSVPRAVYYVRVRAVDAKGLALPSQDIVVAVP